ncbi:hypothetical protein [Acidianus sp. RZ1]|uniref:hypothetical protein n=1 Tax=Acidianus sp. RZ1 TaxID=1540082 RepID=UPI0035304F20
MVTVGEEPKAPKNPKARPTTARAMITDAITRIKAVIAPDIPLFLLALIFDPFREILTYNR